MSQAAWQDSEGIAVELALVESLATHNQEAIEENTLKMRQNGQAIDGLLVLVARLADQLAETRAEVRQLRTDLANACWRLEVLGAPHRPPTPIHLHRK